MKDPDYHEKELIKNLKKGHLPDHKLLLRVIEKGKAKLFATSFRLNGVSICIDRCAYGTYVDVYGCPAIPPSLREALKILDGEEERINELIEALRD